MNLQTQIPLLPEAPQIEYASKIVLMGSCFTENMGGKLDYFQFQNVQNPFGVIFNPVSLGLLIERAVQEIPFSEKDLFEQQGLWQSFEAHSSLAGSIAEEVLENLNAQRVALKKGLVEATHIILTLGTSWVYRFKKTGAIVANCHKVPQQEFTKELLSVADIQSSLEALFSEIKKVNPSATLIFTVSPVRHLKDGFVENTQSKAHLITAIHGLQGIKYFPAYELMMDELRDYRFYGEDMLHPNAIAIEYIWEKFREVWIDPASEKLQKEIDSLQKGLRHQPFQPDSEAHQQFQKSLQEKIETLREVLPWIRFN
ncbi:MAG: GSCFA domain-containing protein [Flavobacteriaceae bacterium]|nr:GSCFA domain-containing protein [Flavobacteriaceae bacterium]|tara:strand:+ start:33022 stop:33960 length:939 start_codon:yes stop_codon:yes gene_type:complete